MYKKILFPFDNSEYSNKALSYVIEIAKKFHSKVILIHAFEMPAIEYTPYYISREEITKEIFESYSKILKNAEDRFKKEGVDVHVSIKEGNVRAVISQTVEDYSCDIVIMGSMGAGSVSNFLLGGISNYVLHHVKCPVLLVS